MLNQRMNGEQCLRSGCAGRLVFFRINAQGKKVWRCGKCRDEVTALRKALEPHVNPTVLVTNENVSITELASLVVDEKLPLADVDPSVRAAVEEQVMTELDRSSR